MKKIIKPVLYKVLGIKNYLRLLYRTLAFALDNGFLKKSEPYLLHQFTKKIIQKGDNILDIGANLGYYTRLFLKATGKSGKVYAVEPVKPFYENLMYFLGANSNLTVFNYALGTEEKEIKLSVPDKHNYLRTGLPRVHDENKMQTSEKLMFFPAKMIQGSVLFQSLEKIDYLKMDIEGFEKFVIPEIKDFIGRTLPCIQIELTKNSKTTIDEVLFSLGYAIYFYQNDRLYKTEIPNYAQDYFYIHPSKIEKYQHLIA